LLWACCASVSVSGGFSSGCDLLHSARRAAERAILASISLILGKFANRRRSFATFCSRSAPVLLAWRAAVAIRFGCSMRFGGRRLCLTQRRKGIAGLKPDHRPLTAIRCRFSSFQGTGWTTIHMYIQCGRVCQGVEWARWRSRACSDWKLPWRGRLHLKSNRPSPSPRAVTVPS
jgi:hypothetical protein